MKDILFLERGIKYTLIYTKDPRVVSTYDPGKNSTKKTRKGA